LSNRWDEFSLMKVTPEKCDFAVVGSVVHPLYHTVLGFSDHRGTSTVYPVDATLCAPQTENGSIAHVNCEEKEP
jgi:hypothetical protein